MRSMANCSSFTPGSIASAGEPGAARKRRLPSDMVQLSDDRTRPHTQRYVQQANGVCFGCDRAVWARRARVPRCGANGHTVRARRGGFRRGHRQGAAQSGVRDHCRRIALEDAERSAVGQCRGDDRRPAEDCGRGDPERRDPHAGLRSAARIGLGKRPPGAARLRGTQLHRSTAGRHDARRRGD